MSSTSSATRAAMTEEARLTGQWIAYSILALAGLGLGALVLRELREARAWLRLDRRITQIGVDQRTGVVERLTVQQVEERRR